jgi:3-hydroxybutyryl-CoA dehydrogenase
MISTPKSPTLIIFNAFTALQFTTRAIFTLSGETALRQNQIHAMPDFQSSDTLKAGGDSPGGSKMEIRKIAVIGAGQMGSGIAQVCACSGYEVSLYDALPGAATKALSLISRLLSRDVEKGRRTPSEVDAILARIHLKDAPDVSADLVIEAITENYELKAGLFRDLDIQCPPNTIFATNTSSIPITRLAANTGRADRFLGLHFFNPVPVMALVEVIRGEHTSPETLGVGVDFVKSIGKTPVESQDVPGFISNRVLMTMINEAIFALYEGVGTAEGIDTVFKLGMRHPMGPLELADFIGLDTCLAILQVLHEGYGDPKYRPCPLLKRMVAAGKLGKKSGVGFYSYT